jgi:hypothetical protein
MTTTRPHSSATLVCIYVLVVAVATALATILSYKLCAPVHRPAAAQQHAWVDGDDSGSGEEGLDGDEIGLVGFAGRPIDSKKPKLTAFFESESYAPGATGRMVVDDTARSVSIQVFRAGGENRPTVPNDVMLGTAVGPKRPIGAVRPGRLVSVRMGDWESGVYFVRLTSGARVGYATFVLRPRRLGEHRIAVVIPTETWQAYNFRDGNHDGYGDTWYAGWRTNHALLIRPFLDRGVPPHWKQYDAPFVRWLTHSSWKVDYISDAELRSVANGRALASAYTLMIFEGHHEYVTTHEYDVVTQYRDLGGNLAFLSANNFFWKIDLDGAVMTRVKQWRDLGRPEAALIGVQYRGNDRGTHRGPWVLRNPASTPWLFAGMELGPNDGIGSGGIEIDETAPSTPRGTTIIGDIPNLFGPGFTAQMTYYETKAGAKVFAAGAFTLAGSADEPEISALLRNLLTKLSRP